VLVLVQVWYIAMAYVAVRSGLHMKVRYLLVQDGRSYYQRRVPLDLRSRYAGANVKVPLGNLDPIQAAKRISALAAAQDRFWNAMRGNASLAPADLQDAARQMLLDAGLEEGIGLDHPVVDSFVNQLIEADRGRGLMPVEELALRALKKPLPLLLSTALAHYLDNHKKGADADFVKRTKADWNRLIGITGDIAVRDFGREQARQVRDALTAEGMRSTSVRRRLNVYRAIFAAIRREVDGSRVNPFERLEIVGLGDDASKREPFTNHELETVVSTCREIDDERRRAIALLAYTGMRLSEALGLVADDLMLEHECPYLVVRPHPWRALKTANSERLIPLVGYGLVVAARLKADAPGKFIFPSYATEEGVSANTASATLNKWLKGVLTKPKTCHELRHTMRDLLRHAGAPKDVIDAIGGWSKDNIGDNYGLGHALKTKADYLRTAFSGLAT